MVLRCERRYRVILLVEYVVYVRMHSVDKAWRYWREKYRQNERCCTCHECLSPFLLNT